MKIISKILKLLKKKKESKFTKDLILKDNILIGKYTYGKPMVYDWTKKYRLVIGKFCSIADNVKIMLDGNHRIDWITTYPFGHLLNDFPKNPDHPTGKGNIIIGNDVWIGRDVLILSGTKIGNGAVIAAGSIVTKDVSDYEVVGGNPAKHIKFRFDEKQIESLNEIKWWNWDTEKIKKNLKLLESSEIDNFIKKFK